MCRVAGYNEAGVDELGENPPTPDISGMPSPARSHTPRKLSGSGAARQSTARATRVEVPPGLSAEEARRALAAFASGAATVQRTGRGLILGIEPTSGRSPSRFRIVRLPQNAPAPLQDSAETAELPPDAARAALQRAYARGAQAAAELLAGPDMLSSDAIAERLWSATFEKTARSPLRSPRFGVAVTP